MWRSLKVVSGESQGRERGAGWGQSRCGHAVVSWHYRRNRILWAGPGGRGTLNERALASAATLRGGAWRYMCHVLHGAWAKDAHAHDAMMRHAAAKPDSRKRKR